MHRRLAHRYLAHPSPDARLYLSPREVPELGVVQEYLAHKKNTNPWNPTAGIWVGAYGGLWIKLFLISEVPLYCLEGKNEIRHRTFSSLALNPHRRPPGASMTPGQVRGMRPRIKIPLGSSKSLVFLGIS